MWVFNLTDFLKIIVLIILNIKYTFNQRLIVNWFFIGHLTSDISGDELLKYFFNDVVILCTPLIRLA